MNVFVSISATIVVFNNSFFFQYLKHGMTNIINDWWDMWNVASKINHCLLYLLSGCLVCFGLNSFLNTFVFFFTRRILMVFIMYYCASFLFHPVFFCLILILPIADLALCSMLQIHSNDALCLISITLFNLISFYFFFLLLLSVLFGCWCCWCVCQSVQFIHIAISYTYKHICMYI